MRKSLPTAVLALALTLLATLSPCASSASSATAIVFRDGSVLPIVNASAGAPTALPMNLTLVVEPRGSATMVLVNGSSPRPMGVERLSLNSSGSYTYLGNASRVLVRLELFEDLGREGTVELLANVSTYLNYSAMRKVDRIEMKLSATGAAREILAAVASFLSRESIEEQLRSSGINWINVSKASAKPVGNAIAIELVLETNLKGLAGYLARLRGESPETVLKSLEPPNASFRYALRVESSNSGTRFSAEVVGWGNPYEVLNVLGSSLALPTFGVKGVEVGGALSKAIATALDVAKTLARDLEPLYPYIENPSTTLRLSISSGVAHLQLRGPRIVVRGGSPIDALRVLAIALSRVSKDFELPKWVRGLASAVLSEVVTLKPGEPGVSMPVESVSLGELAKPRTVTISVSLPRATTSISATTTLATTPAATSIASTSSASASPTTVSGLAPGILPVIATVVGLGAALVAILLAIKWLRR